MNTMKKFLTAFLFSFISFFTFAEEEYEEIVLTNSVGEVKTIKIRQLMKVRDIYEVRDFALLPEYDPTSYLYLHKLLPPYISVTNCEIQDVEMTNMSVVDLTAESPNITKIEVIVDESVYSELEELKKEAEYEDSYRERKMSIFLKDYNNLTEEMRRTWLTQLLAFDKSYISYVPCNESFKITSEIRLVNNTFDKNLASTNLVTLKKLGYDSVLVRFDTTENIESMTNMISFVKSNGFNVFLTYVGLDNANWNPYTDPEIIYEHLKAYTPMAKGMFLNWRSTSSHVKLLPMEFFNYLAHTARIYNQNLLIFGEVYYGKIDYLGGQKKMVSSVVENASGILINNMGYYGYNHAYIVNKLFSKVVKNYNAMPKIAQVIGLKPYYCSKDNSNLTLEQEYKYKKSVEDSFFRSNCSTITLLHDGVDDNFTEKYSTVDNILYDTKISNIK